MNFFGLLHQENKPKHYHMSHQTSILTLLPKSLQLCNFKTEDLSTQQTDGSKEIVLSSVKTVKVYEIQQSKDTQMVEEQTFFEQSNVNVQNDCDYQKQIESIKGQTETFCQSKRQIFAKGFYFQNFIEEMLNGKSIKICILNSMIYQPFDYLFLWSSHLESFKHIKANQPQEVQITLIRIVCGIQGRLLEKYCNRDKQKVIERILHTKYSIKDLHLENSLMKESQMVRSLNHILESHYISEQIRQNNNQDISLILNYIKNKRVLCQEQIE